MLNSIKAYFEAKLNKNDESDGELSTSSSNLASAALLIEVMKSDHELDQRESDEFMALLQSSLNIPAEELEAMRELAEAQASQATSLYEFTRLINDEYDYDEKLRLIENMWRIAFSDDELDKYEEHLIRKVSELIYVSHSDFIRLKLKVRE